MYRTDFWSLWEKARVGWSERIALKHVYYQVWNRSPVQVGCMRPVLRAVALGRPWVIGWRGRWEGGSGWGTYVNPWLIHVNVWQKSLQYCKVISLQLIKIKKKNKKQKHNFANKSLYSQIYDFVVFFSSSHIWMWELNHNEGWLPKNWCFPTVVLEKTVESPLDCKENKPVNPKRHQPWIFIGRTDAEAPILRPPDGRHWT